MPVEDRDARRTRVGATYNANSGSRPPTPPTPPPLAPTPGTTGTSGGRRRRRYLSFKTVRRIVYLLIVAYIVSLVWTGLSVANAITRVDWEPSGARPSDQPGTNYLVVASDSRKGLTKKQRKKLSTGDAAGQRTDTIKLLHTGSGPNLLMTIPRDSYVPVPGHGTTKINAAFAYGGPQLLVKTIEQDTGLHIDGYVEIGMGGLVNLVNGVGGITICPTKAMNDPLAGLHVKAGCQHANGVKALAYSRSRHAQQLGDLGRGEAQTEVIGQIGKRAASPGTLLNPFKLHRLKKGTSGISVGKGMGTIQMAKFALAMKSVSSGKALACGVPISDMYIHWDQARAKKMFSYLKADRTADLPAGVCTPSGLPKSVTG
jgi:LCP family protein required for cell wall assembly